ncbi:thioredoxin-like [Teleopsis dalmanni]|uniref:thioredoxin-like n=1 Tax=Teleopsis dalmanni TaxID=139649 RepID=UPI0018CE8AE1|nr:thioredoxin-like [Teleopsis dalmanni]
MALGKYRRIHLHQIIIESGKASNGGFLAVWCGPCRMVGPVVEELATEYQGKAVVGKVDVDTNQEIAAKYGIRNIPTILFFKDGEVVDKVVGVVPKEQLKKQRLNARVSEDIDVNAVLDQIEEKILQIKNKYAIDKIPDINC